MALEKIIEVLENKYSVLLVGSGGTGKTYLLKEIATYFSRKDKLVACTAATGIAAINLTLPEQGITGSTLHSWAGVGLADGSHDEILARVVHNPRARKRWMSTNILIIDEISMLGADFIDKVDYIGRNIRRVRDLPFGGIQIIFSGDFLQLPPVKDKWMFQSNVWQELDKKLMPFILETPQRYKDVSWFEMLLRFRKAQHTPEDVKFLKSRVKAYDEWLAKNNKSKDLTLIKPTILYSKRIDVDSENEKELAKLPGQAKEFRAHDSFESFNPYGNQEYYSKPLDDAIPKFLVLKVGAQVMLKTNLDVEAGLVNGSRGVITETFDTSVQVKWLDGSSTLIAPFTWEQKDKDGKMTRTQIPLILAWSCTFHKVQGCTLDYAICDIGPSIFCPGQAYVALSRVRSSEGLLLSDYYIGSIKADPDALKYMEEIVKINPDTIELPSEVKETRRLKPLPPKDVIFEGELYTITFRSKK